jgi:hypothetical protein
MADIKNFVTTFFWAALLVGVLIFFKRDLFNQVAMKSSPPIGGILNPHETTTQTCEVCSCEEPVEIIREKIVKEEVNNKVFQDFQQTLNSANVSKYFHTNNL